jgi:hypothetical protein
MSWSARRQELTPSQGLRSCARSPIAQSDIADRALAAPGVLHNTYYTELNPAGAAAKRG